MRILWSGHNQPRLPAVVYAKSAKRETADRAASDAPETASASGRPECATSVPYRPTIPRMERTVARASACRLPELTCPVRVSVAATFPLLRYGTKYGTKVVAPSKPPTSDESAPTSPPSLAPREGKSP